MLHFGKREELKAKVLYYYVTLIQNFCENKIILQGFLDDQNVNVSDILKVSLKYIF